MSEPFLLYPLVGLCSGFLAGLLGIGGGLVVVPALLLIFPYQGLPAGGIAHSAVATSLATVIITSLVAAYTHHRHHAVAWSVVGSMAPGLLGGALGGAMLTFGLSGIALRGLFGGFALLVAMQMAFRLQFTAREHLPSAAARGVAGAIIGLISAMVGVGGGTLTVPFLRWGGMAMQRAVATSSACGLPIALGGSLGYTLMEALAGHAAAIPVGIYWPAALWIGAASLAAAPLGARMTHRIDTSVLNRIFAALLAIVGLRLIWTTLQSWV